MAAENVGLAPEKVQLSKAKSALIALPFILGAVSPAALFAKDRELDPVEKPGECPIDAPVRVASLDSLRQFEGLIGHCPETSIVESPAYTANRPKTVPVSREVEDYFPDEEIYLDGRLILTRAPRGDGGKKSKMDEGVRTLRRADGGAVAIVPAASSFADETSDVSAIGAGGDADAEAILALRPQSYETPFDDKIAAAARRHGVDPLLLHAVITQKSRYRSRAVSHAGARGLMQVMPGTGRMLGVKQADHLFDPDVNINAGAKLLSDLWRRMDGNIDLVLAAYNAGEGAVRKYGMAVPPYRETRNYVVKVKAIYTKLAGESGLAVNF